MLKIFVEILLAHFIMGCLVDSDEFARHLLLDAWHNECEVSEDIFITLERILRYKPISILLRTGE